MGKRYFEFVEGTSSKFWEVWMGGNEVFTRYGKIGADGQTTVKDQGSPESAQKLYDKLVREKTGKGYEEKTAGRGGGAGAAPAKGGKADDYKSRWNAIVGKTGKDLAAALEKEWAFMAEMPTCKPALTLLASKARAASIDDDKLVIEFDSQWEDDNKAMFSPPETEDVSGFPKSWQTLAKAYARIELESPDVGIAFNGGGGGGFEQEYMEEVEPELYEKVQEKELSFDSPIDNGQDWVVANPLKKNKLGEPMLYAFSHEGSGLDSPYPADLGLPAVWLLIMTEHITGKDFFDRKDDDGGDDDDDDDGNGDEDGEGGDSEAQRFEFSDGSSNKFWEIRVEGSTHTVRFGKIGTDGQTKTKEFDSAIEARADADKLIAEKTKKGYEKA